MDRVHNETGNYCFKDGYICDHNMIDAPDIKMNKCSGYCKKCINGSEWEWYEKEIRYLHHASETIGKIPPPHEEE